MVMADPGMSWALCVLTQTAPDSLMIISLIYTNLYNIRPIHVKENLLKLTGFPIYRLFRIDICSNSICSKCSNDLLDFKVLLLAGGATVKQHGSFIVTERVIKTLKYECLKHVPGIVSVNYRNLISLYLALCLVYDSFS